MQASWSGLRILLESNDVSELELTLLEMITTLREDALAEVGLDLTGCVCLMKCTNHPKTCT